MQNVFNHNHALGFPKRDSNLPMMVHSADEVEQMANWGASIRRPICCILAEKVVETVG